MSSIYVIVLENRDSWDLRLKPYDYENTLKKYNLNL